VRANVDRSLFSLQIDENNALKETLRSTLSGKREDVAVFSEMAEQTKQVFMEALRSFGKSKNQ